MKNLSTSKDLIDDSILWKNLKAGDEKAFSQLFERYYKYLVHYGKSFSSFPEKVQDCVQDVFADIWVYRDNLSEYVMVKGYLLSSVRKRLSRSQERDYVFRETTSVDSIKFLFDFSIEYHLIADEETASKVIRLNALLNELPPRQKEALYLRYYQGLSVEQIADIFQVNYQSANNLLYRALLKLRKDWKAEFWIILILSSVFFN